MLRNVAESDLPIFFEHQRDPDATAMAAFPSREWALLSHIGVTASSGIRPTWCAPFLSMTRLQGTWPVGNKKANVWSLTGWEGPLGTMHRELSAQHILE